MQRDIAIFSSKQGFKLSIATATKALVEFYGAQWRLSWGIGAACANGKIAESV
jgi:hypothetical protein